jgi:hypothetical protein
MTGHTDQPDPHHPDGCGPAAPPHDSSPQDRSSGQPAPDPEPAWLPQIPPGARLLSADEAVDLLVTGDHAESPTGNLLFDVALIDLLRVGTIVACQLPDGRLAFTRPTPPT